MMVLRPMLAGGLSVWSYAFFFIKIYFLFRRNLSVEDVSDNQLFFVIYQTQHNEKIQLLPCKKPS